MTKPLEELIRNAYNTRDASHMALGKDYAYWTSRPVANTRNLTVNQLVDKFLLTNLKYSQPDYLDRDMYTKNSVEPTRPLCIATPRPYRSTGGAEFHHS